MTKRNEVPGITLFGALTFDSRGGFDRPAVESVLRDVADSGVEDVYVIAHGACNTEETADAFDHEIARLLAAERADDTPPVGLLGVRWPSVRLRDEPVPGLTADETRAACEARPALTPPGLDDLRHALPRSHDAVDTIDRLLTEQPTDDTSFDDLGTALREIARVPLDDPRADYTSDTAGELLPQADPLMLFEDTREVCAEFAGALRDAEKSSRRSDHRPERQERPELASQDAAPSEHGTLREIATAGPRPAEPLSDRVSRTGTVSAAGPLGDARLAQDPADLWYGAHELLRQVVYHVLRRRAGLVGELGLGPCLYALAEASKVRIHLVGHGLGGRVASFALRGLEQDGEQRLGVWSLTLLQAAMSHFAFARSLPQQISGHGALWDREDQVRRPVVACFSHHDLSLGLMFPLSTQMLGDAAELSTVGRKWGAMGFDGMQGVRGTEVRDIEQVLREGLPEDESYVNVDASSVVRRGDAPVGAHHDVLHPAVARLLLGHLPAPSSS
ncbi:hypothetical protein [Streptomyces sp. NPDC050560]|uniref:hypothetical protein n=1 Tax=Streptomyces sp. NPDC050560 TaxID=3365630 RepID=UPI00379D7376